jgi:hypothetical protein
MHRAQTHWLQSAIRNRESNNNSLFLEQFSKFAAAVCRQGVCKVGRSIVWGITQLVPQR